MPCAQEAADLATRAAQEQQRQLQEAAAKAARFEAQVAAAAAEFAAAVPPPAGPGTVNIAVKLPSGKRPTRRCAMSLKLQTFTSMVLYAQQCGR